MYFRGNAAGRSVGTVIVQALLPWVLAMTLSAIEPGPSSKDLFNELQENAWYLPTADGQARLYVTSMGHGPTVVVLHGGPGNDFHYLVDALRPAARSHKILFLEQRGSLLSPVPEAKKKSLTVEQLISDLETLRLAIGEDRLLLLGHSFGTFLAQSYFVKHPKQVAGLVLIASCPPRTPPEGDFLTLVRAMRTRIKVLRAREEVQTTLRVAGLKPDGATPGLSSEQLWQKFRIEGLASFNLVHVDRWRQLHGGGVFYDSSVDDAIGASVPLHFNIEPALRESPIPITVIQGDSDYADPSAETWKALVGDLVRVKILANAGHYSWVDDRAGFNRFLREALMRANRLRHNSRARPNT
jgi:pimeloyl-ACP methyl ester carboxylesterase